MQASDRALASIPSPRGEEKSKTIKIAADTQDWKQRNVQPIKTERKATAFSPSVACSVLCKPLLFLPYLASAALTSTLLFLL